MPDPFVLVPAGTLDDRAAGDVVDLPRDTVHHLSRVLRLRDGDAIVAADGRGAVARGRLVGGAVEVVAAPDREPARPPRVHVWQALGKGRKHDEVVRVLTELGVDAITAVTSERTVVDLGGKADRARERWRKVAWSACEQARRSRLPELAGPTAAPDLVATLEGRPCLLAHVGAGGEAGDPLSAATDAVGAGEVVLVVGPEGGWTDDEVAAFRRAGAVTVGLGPTVLRTEHAATVLASIVLAAAGRLSPRP